jgi:hypothetical protein
VTLNRRRFIGITTVGGGDVATGIEYNYSGAARSERANSEGNVQRKEHDMTSQTRHRFARHAADEGAEILHRPAPSTADESGGNPQLDRNTVEDLQPVAKEAAQLKTGMSSVEPRRPRRS